MQTNSLSKKFLGVVKLLFLVLVFFTTFYLLDTVFRVKEIVIDKKNQLNGINAYMNKNLLMLSESSIKNELIIKNPLIKTIEVKKKFPSTIIISIIPEKPLAKLIVGQGFFYLSENGKIIAKTREELDETITINYYQKLNFQSHRTGEFIGYADIMKAVGLITLVEDSGFKVDNVDIGGVDVILFNLGDKNLIFSSVKNIEEQLYQWREIARQFKIEGKSYREVDLRYDKPIVRF